VIAIDSTLRRRAGQELVQDRRQPDARQRQPLIHDIDVCAIVRLVGGAVLGSSADLASACDCMAHSAGVPCA